MLYAQPAHPYTAALLAAIPVPDPGNARPTTRACSAARSRRTINPPSGCRFRTRCPKAQDALRRGGARRSATCGPDQYVACHFPLAPGEAIAFGDG